MSAAPPHGTVNQFAAGGRFPSGQSSVAYDCTVAVGVMALDAWSGGALDPSTTTLRGLQRDQTEGIGLDDLAVAYKALGLGGSWVHGVKPWTAVRKRLEAGGGVAIQGTYLALGDHRAPGSTFKRGHALYLEAIAGDQVKVHDPLRSSPVWIPESAVKRFYYSGLASAGWFTGTYGGVSAGSAGAVAGAGSGSGAGQATVRQVFRATTAAGCDQVIILAPANPLETQAIPIPRERIGDPCTRCPDGWSPAIVDPGPLRRTLPFLAGAWVLPEQVPGQANACVAPGVKEGDHPDAQQGTGAVGGALGQVFTLSLEGLAPLLVNGLVLVGVVGLAYSGLSDLLEGG